MARRRRDLPEPEEPVDPARDFRHLGWLLLSFDPAHPLGERLRLERDVIKARRAPPAEQLAELWAVVDGLGLREFAERHMRRFNRPDPPKGT